MRKIVFIWCWQIRVGITLLWKKEGTNPRVQNVACLFGFFGMYLFTINRETGNLPVKNRSLPKKHCAPERGYVNIDRERGGNYDDNEG